MASKYSNVVRGGLKLKGSSSGPATVSLGKSQRRKRRSSPTTTRTSYALHESPLNQNEYITKDSALQTEEADLNDIETTESIPNLNDTDTGCLKKQKIEINHDDNPFKHDLLETVIDEGSYLTAAEKAFRIAQKKREAERTSKRLELTHRQRMERFNSHLMNLPEHFDIPKVGPG